MKLSMTMKHVRVAILAASTAFFLAGPVSAHRHTSRSADANNGSVSMAVNGDTGSGANANRMGINGVASDADNGMGTNNGTGVGTNNPNNAGTGLGPGYGNNYGYNYGYKPSAGGYGLWGLLGLIGLFGLLRGGRTRVTPSTPTYTRTEEYTRPRA